MFSLEQCLFFDATQDYIQGISELDADDADNDDEEEDYVIPLNPAQNRVENLQETIQRQLITGRFDVDDDTAENQALTLAPFLLINKNKERIFGQDATNPEALLKKNPLTGIDDTGHRQIAWWPLYYAFLKQAMEDTILFTEQVRKSHFRHLWFNETTCTLEVDPIWASRNRATIENLTQRWENLKAEKVAALQTLEQQVALTTFTPDVLVNTHFAPLLEVLFQKNTHQDKNHTPRKIREFTQKFQADVLELKTKHVEFSYETTACRMEYQAAQSMTVFKLNQPAPSNPSLAYQQLAEASIRAAILTAKPGTPPIVVIRGQLDDPRIMKLVKGLKEALINHYLACWLEIPACAPSIELQGPLTENVLQEVKQEALRRILLDHDTPHQGESALDRILNHIQPRVSQDQLAAIRQKADQPKRIKTLEAIIALAAQKKDTQVWQYTQKITPPRLTQ